MNKCINCESDKLHKKYITWTTNGTTVQKIKCQKCGEVMWRTNLSKDEIEKATESVLKLKQEPVKECGQLEFDF